MPLGELSSFSSLIPHGNGIPNSVCCDVNQEIGCQHCCYEGMRKNRSRGKKLGWRWVFKCLCAIEYLRQNQKGVWISVCIFMWVKNLSQKGTCLHHLWKKKIKGQLIKMLGIGLKVCLHWVQIGQQQTPFENPTEIFEFISCLIQQWNKQNLAPFGVIEHLKKWMKNGLAQGHEEAFCRATRGPEVPALLYYPTTSI